MTTESSMDRKIGVVLPTRQDAASDRGDARQAIALAQTAERLGFDSVWAGESILARPRFEPLTLLAAIAAQTERVELGTGVMLPALHAPLALAQRLATLDCVSQGRLVVGAGIGIDNPDTRREFATAGVPFAERVGRLVETVRLCRTLWSDDPSARAKDAPGRVTKYWDLSDAEVHPRPHRPGGPPFWVGSTFSLEAALRRAGREFDGWFPTCPNPEAFEAGWSQVRQAAADAGRDANVTTPAVYLTISLDDDPAKAEAVLGDYVENYYGLPFDVMRKVQGLFAGTPVDCVAWVQRFLDAGARHVVLRSPRIANHLDWIADEVLLPLREENRR